MGYTDVVEYLPGQEVNVNAQGCSWEITTTRSLISIETVSKSSYHGGITPLMLAALACFIETVRLLLQHGADRDSRGSDENTALVYAAEKLAIWLIVMSRNWLCIMLVY